MLTFLLSLFSSSGFGALIGWIGGLANRWVDFKTRQLDIELRKLDHQHELDMLNATTEQLKMEWESRAQVASIENEAKIEAAGYAAMGASYVADKATYGMKSVDWVRGMIRPLLTVIVGGFALYVNYVILEQLVVVWKEVSTAEQIKIALMAVEWVFFQASVVIGWWFANRPSHPFKFK
jgi:hypothetical protein